MLIYHLPVDVTVFLHSFIDFNVSGDADDGKIH